MDNSIKLKFEGGIADKGVISFRALQSIMYELQNITGNLVAEEFENKNIDLIKSIRKKEISKLYLTDYSKGSVDLGIQLLNIFNTLYGVGNHIAYEIIGAVIYDNIIKKMKDNVNFESAILPNIKKFILNLYQKISNENDTKKKNILESELISTKKEIEIIFSNYKSMVNITNVIDQEIKTLSFKSSKQSLYITEREKKRFKKLTDKIFYINESFKISGIPIKLNRRDNSVYIKTFLLKNNIKLYVNDGMLNEISDYFRDKKAITVEGVPIIKMGDYVRTLEFRVDKLIY